MSTEELVTELNDDTELLILSFCDIVSVLNYSYCSQVKYDLVHNSNWLWEQHTMAELKLCGGSLLPSTSETTQNWKAEYIDAYTTKFDLDFNPDSCKHKETCFAIHGKTASRKDFPYPHVWERIVSKNIMKEHTLYYFEFSIDKHHVYDGNVFRIVVGAIEKDVWPYDAGREHLNIIGLRGGFSFIVGNGQLYNCGEYLANALENEQTDIELKSVKSGDVIGFRFDNGYTNPVKVTVNLYLNGKDYGVLNKCEKLPVAEYRPAMCLCLGQQVSVRRVTKLHAY
jgi:hypothetical protein